MTIAERLSGRRIAGVGLAAILSIAGVRVFTQTNEGSETIIRNWPKEIQAQARALIERYGEPSASDANALVWFNNGPWRKTVMHREGFTQAVMGRDRDHLEQAIDYPVPEDKVADIRRFDKRIEVNRATDEMSSHADAESMNFLALNLADEIVKGERTAQGARVFYRKVQLLEKAGKSSPYLEGLLFTKKNVKEPDAAAPEKGTEESGMSIPEKDRKKMEYPPAYDDVPKR